jgi:hypothetical protein
LYGISSAAGDNDNDGVTNFEEYAFGLNPINGSQASPIIVPLDQTSGRFSFTRRTPSLTGLTYTIWYSSNLSIWTQDTGASIGTLEVHGDVQTVPITISSSLLSNSKLFIRVRAQ